MKLVGRLGGAFMGRAAVECWRGNPACGCFSRVHQRGESASLSSAEGSILASSAALMPFCIRALLLIAVSLLLAPCNAQSGANTTFYLDVNCSSTCSNCTVSNPIITAGGCVQERNDVNSSSITTACNASHVTGTSAPLRPPPPFIPLSCRMLARRLELHHIQLQRRAPSIRLCRQHLPPRHFQQRHPPRLLIRPNRVPRSACIRFPGPQGRPVWFANSTLPPCHVNGAQTNINCFPPAPHCHRLKFRCISLLKLHGCVRSAAISSCHSFCRLHVHLPLPLRPHSTLSLTSHPPSLPLLSVSDSGLLYLTLPATAPLGSAFALSIAFSNLAALHVAMVNMSVVVPPFLQVRVLPHRIPCNPRHLLPRNVINLPGCTITPICRLRSAPAFTLLRAATCCAPTACTPHVTCHSPLKLIDC